MQIDTSKLIDPALPKEAQIAALRRAVEECYCGLGPACHLWREMSAEQRVECSADKRLTAQRLWLNGM